MLLESLNVSDLGEVFETFNEKPTAAASLAQVHYAVTNEKFGNANVQLKFNTQVFHAKLEAIGSLLKVITDVVGYLFPDYAYGWMLPEFKKVAEEELDFTRGQERYENEEKYGNVRERVCSDRVQRYN